MLVKSTRTFVSKQEVLSELSQKTLVAVDSETDITDNTLLGVAIAWSPQDAVWFDADDPDIPLTYLSTVPTIFQNCLWDADKLRERYGIVVNIAGDTMLLAQSCGYPAALANLAFPIGFNHRPVTSLLYDSAGGKLKKAVPSKVKGRMKHVPLTLKDAPRQEVGEICCEHAQATYLIWEKLKGSMSAAYTLDMELIPLLLSMHKRGIRVDASLARERHKQVSTEVEAVRLLCEGLGFNPASPKQIGLALSHIGLVTHFTKAGNMVTDEEALLPLMDKTSIVPLVLKYREKSKLDSTYLRPLCSVSRVYPRYHIVRTGRFATESPNAQNIPEVQRDLYLPNEGEYFWDADAHQIEPVLMAYLSGDIRMIADVSTGDLYQPIAERYHIQRYTAKQLVLATSYEAGAEKLVETAHSGRGGIRDNLSYEDGQRLITQYYLDYSRFKEWKEEVKQEARSKGYTCTLLGRIRTLEDMAEGEEEGYDPLLKVVNSKVQGSGADILKLAMKRVMDRKVALTCHDELLISTTADISADVLTGLCNVPVHWKIRKGGNWYDLS